MTTTTTRKSRKAAVAAPPAPVTLTKAQLETVTKYEQVKAAARVLAEQKEELERQIRDALGAAPAGLTPAGVVRVRIDHRNRSNVDRTKLQHGWPEAYAATLVQTSYTVVVTV